MRKFADAALKQIETLPDAHYRTGRRLLDLASPQGRVSLTIDVMMMICRTTAAGTMRAHLIALKNAGVLCYKIRRGQVNIDFLAWSPAGKQANTEGNHV